MGRMRDILPKGPTTSQIDLESQKTSQVQCKKIESYPPGYPRFAALVGADPAFNVARRFNAFLARNAQILHFNDAPVNIVTSLQRWVGSNGGIARDETEFLDHSDSITLSTPVDCTLKDIESWIRAWLDPALSPSRCADLSDDPNIFIPSDLLTMRLARAVLGLLIIILLMVPVFVCNSVVERAPRLAVIGVSTTAFVAMMSGLTRAKSVELFVAGAAHATVLTVFITQ
ncbi:hypothetical protein BJX66DRAFT_332967 [Aspergillus keveii]|uniref:DUF6594 domain-containing protein n=1 Tax=Aspergillus keveii TaxID=714993 RepID=A0ABR4GK85_9EURO